MNLRSPALRVKAAKWLLIGSVFGMVANVLAYRPFHLIDENMLLLITLILSWLAITLTAADILATTDTRNNLD
jgi:hypothetical protein